MASAIEKVLEIAATNAFDNNSVQTCLDAVKDLSDNIDLLIGGAPAHLDTIKELSDALDNSGNLATNLIAKIDAIDEKASNSGGGGLDERPQWDLTQTISYSNTPAHYPGRTDQGSFGYGTNNSNNLGEGAVAINGNYLAIYKCYNGWSVWVLKRESSTSEFKLFYKTSIGLNSSASNYHSKNSLKIDNDGLVYLGISSNKGKIQILDTEAQTSTELEPLSDLSSNSYFGRGLCIAGDYLFVTAEGNKPTELNNTGSIFIYKRDGNNKFSGNPSKMVHGTHDTSIEPLTLQNIGKLGVIAAEGDYFVTAATWYPVSGGDSREGLALFKKDANEDWNRECYLDVGYGTGTSYAAAEDVVIKNSKIIATGRFGRGLNIFNLSGERTQYFDTSLLILRRVTIMFVSDDYLITGGPETDDYSPTIYKYSDPSWNKIDYLADILPINLTPNSTSSRYGHYSSYYNNELVFGQIYVDNNESNTILHQYGAVYHHKLSNTAVGSVSTDMEAPKIMTKSIMFVDDEISLQNKDGTKLSASKLINIDDDISCNAIDATDASFNNAYIEELTISQSSLFMDNGDGTKTKVLHKEGAELKLETSTNQNMSFSTSGTGLLKLQSEGTGNLMLSSGNNLQLDASGNIELQSSNGGTINVKSKLNITNGIKVESTGDFVEIYDGLKVQSDISGQNIFATGKGIFDGIETTSLKVNGVTIDTNGGGGGSGGGTSLTTTSDISINAIDAQDASFNSLTINGVDINTTTTAQEGQIIEIVSGTCDGRDVIAKSGTYTLPNVTAVQALTETYTDITGSSISYKPPAGTRYVKYSNRFHLSYDTAGGGWAHAGVQLYIDDVAQGTINFIGNSDYGDEYETAEWIIAIGDTTDASGIKLSEWTSNKTLKIKMRERNSDRQAQVHKAHYLDSVGGNNNDILQPSLTITAIGQSSIIGSSSSGTSLTTTSDISINAIDAVDASFNTMETSGTFSMGGHILPKVNAQYDLGSAEYKIRHLFLSDNSLWLGDQHKIDVDGGKMRFKKRKTGTGFVPKEILDASSNSTADDHINGLIALFDDVNTVDDIKLHHWEAWVGDVAQSGVSNLLPHQLFLNDDNFEENIENESKAVMFTSPVFTGTPVAPTPTTGDNTTQIATTAFVKTSIDNLVGGAPGALDTLNELAAAIGDDANYASTITNALATKADLTGATFTGHVKVVDLSANDASFNYVDTDVLTAGSFKISTSNLKLGTRTIIDGGAGASISSLEVKNQGNVGLYANGQTGLVQVSGTLEVDTISEKTSANGTVINGVTIKNNGITAGLNGVISATNFNIGSQYIVSAARQALFTGLEIKHGTTNDLNIHLQEDGDAEFMGDISANKGIFSTNLGVGTTSASQILTVQTGTDYDGIILNNEDGNLLFKAARANSKTLGYMGLYDAGSSPSAIVEFTNSGNHFIKSGNLGIGTTNPQTKLHVAHSALNQTSGDVSIRSEGTIRTYAFDYDVHIRSEITNHADGGKLQLYNSFNPNEVIKIKLSAKENEINYIDNGGNLGIGTTSPNNKLDVNGGISAYSSFIQSTSTNGTYITMTSQSSTNKQFELKIRDDTTSSYPLHIGPGTGFDGINIKHSNGNVGIGTAVPTRDLQVKNNTGSAYFELTHNAGNHLLFGAGGAKNYIYSRNSSGGNYGLGFQVGTTDVMTFDTNYRVGIGTTSPVCNLEVNGSTSLSMSTRGYLNSEGNTGSSTSTNSAGVSIKATGGYIWATNAVIVTSDERIKTNIADIADDLSLKKLRDIQCYSYNYIDNNRKSHGKQIGFLAQQVREHLPEAVSIQKSFVPDMMKMLENISWTSQLFDDKEKFYMRANELKDVSGVMYKFYVTNDLSDNEICINVMGNKNNMFLFDKKWNHVFCYGKEVEDFHTLDKAKLFAVNFSATQEIDRIQQQEKEKVQSLEIKLEETEAKFQETQSKFEVVQKQLEEMKDLVSSLTIKVEELEMR